MLKNKTIAIAGTVGVGKSSLAKVLGENIGVQVMYENVDSNPYLKKYYDDFTRWSFHLQIFFLAQRFKSQQSMFSYGQGYIMDRTIYEDLEIFAKMNYDNQSMSEDDWITYKELFEAMVLTPFFKAPDIIIYLDGDINQIIDRIQERARTSELQTDKQYWLDLHSRYQEWISDTKHSKILRLNINDYDINDPKSIDSIIIKINKVLEIS